MSTAAKRFKAVCVKNVYQAAYECKFLWDTMLPEELSAYFCKFEHAFNCPIAVSLPSTLTLIAALAGPKTRMQIREQNFDVPLNTYSFVIASPGGGKSSAFSKIVEPVLEAVENDLGATIGVETYTVAGLQRLHLESQGRAILVSDEGHRVLAGINAKQNRSEGERALLSKMWGGKGDTSCLLDRQRGFKETSFSLLLYIQPGPFLAELGQMTIDDGFLDRMLFFTVKPQLHLTEEIETATQDLRTNYGHEYLPKLLMKIYDHHKTDSHLYKFSPPAQQYYNQLSDEHALEFNRRYANPGIFF